MKRRTFLGVLAAAVGFRLTPDPSFIGIDWATKPDSSVVWTSPPLLSVAEVRFLESRQFEVAEIARVFNVPARLLERSA